MALVIGNADYLHESKLGNPANDARLISRTLRGLGFTVEEKLNLRQREMTLAVGRFVRESAGADTALLYYAGHGMQPLSGGRNYLLPVDANIDSDDALDADAIPADRIVEQLERQANPARLRLVVLDACRNNRQASRARSGVRGLARMAPSDDYTLIAFSTNDQDVAQDGSGANSPYAEALSRHLARAKELPMRRVFELTATDVREATKQKQRPRTYGDLDSRVGLDGLVLASIVPEPVSPSPSPQRPGPGPAPIPGPLPAPSPSPAAVTAGSVVKDCEACPALVVLPAGRYRMGSPDGEVGRRKGEGPVREVTIGYRLAVGRSEVSRGEFGRFATASGYVTEAERTVGSKGCLDGASLQPRYMEGRSWRSPGFEQGEDHPVVCVSWNDAQAYLKWLNEQAPGKGYRLLSEAEWEYAARAGMTTRYAWGADASNVEQCGHANGLDETAQAQVPGYANFVEASCRDGFAYTAPGLAFKPNAYGLHHMHGNAWEWVQDVWHDDYAGGPTDGSAWTTGGNQARRVLRGGSWYNTPEIVRSAVRNWVTPANLDYGTGFRIARTF